MQRRVTFYEADLAVAGQLYYRYVLALADAFGVQSWSFCSWLSAKWLWVLRLGISSAMSLGAGMFGDTVLTMGSTGCAASLSVEWLVRLLLI